MGSTKKLLSCLTEVLEIVKQDDLIKGLQEIKENYKKGSYQDLVIQSIITNTCNTIFISRDDLMYQKFHCAGKRVLAYGIVGYLMKEIYFKNFSLKQICCEFNNNVSTAHLHKYIKRIYELNPKKNIDDRQIEEYLQTITKKVNEFIEKSLNK